AAGRSRGYRGGLLLHSPDRTEEDPDRRQRRNRTPKEDRIDDADRRSKDAAEEGPKRNRSPDDGTHSGVPPSLDSVGGDRLPQADLVDVVDRNHDIGDESKNAEHDDRRADQRQRRGKLGEPAHDDGHAQGRSQPEGSRRPGREKRANQPAHAAEPKDDADEAGGKVEVAIGEDQEDRAKDHVRTKVGGTGAT